MREADNNLKILLKVIPLFLTILTPIMFCIGYYTHLTYMGKFNIPDSLIEINFFEATFMGFRGLILAFKNFRPINSPLSKVFTLNPKKKINNFFELIS